MKHLAINVFIQLKIDFCFTKFDWLKIITSLELKYFIDLIYYDKAIYCFMTVMTLRINLNYRELYNGVYECMPKLLNQSTGDIIIKAVAEESLKYVNEVVKIH